MENPIQLGTSGISLEGTCSTLMYSSTGNQRINIFNNKILLRPLNILKASRKNC